MKTVTLLHIRGIKMADILVYTKDMADATFVAKNATMPAGKNVTDTVTFQDLINLGIVKDPNA